MNENKYNELLRFAKYCLPSGSLLEPGDIVNEAYLLVEPGNESELKRKIKGLALAQRGTRTGVIKLEHMNYKDNAVVITTQVCKRCSREKRLDDFGKVVKGAATYYRSICQACTCKLVYQKKKADPDTYKKHLSKRRQQDRQYRAKKTGRQPKDWESVLSRIKAKIDGDDWQILFKQLTKHDLIPDALMPTEPIIQPASKSWTHNHIEFLYEFHAELTPAEIASKLKRPEPDVVAMMTDLTLPILNRPKER